MISLVTFDKIKIEIWGKLHLKEDFKGFLNRSYFLKIDSILAEILALVGDSILLAKVV